MESQLSLSLVELIVFMLGAISLGFTIHFFIVSRRNIRATSPIVKQKINKELEERKLRYLNDIEWRDKQIAALKRTADEAEQNLQVYEIEAKELREENKRLRESVSKEEIKEERPAAGSYLEPLARAQENLKAYNEKISELIGQIDIIREVEEREKSVRKENEILLKQVDDLRSRLFQKEQEIHSTRQRQEISLEMNSLLDNAYNEFNVMQEKMRKLEQQVAVSKRKNFEFEDLQEEISKLISDLEEQKLRRQSADQEKSRLENLLAETEEKLREQEYQVQQLQRRVACLEGINDDMNSIAEINKKLESQIKRIGELESMLNIVSEERDQLYRRQMNAG